MVVLVWNPDVKIFRGSGLTRPKAKDVVVRDCDNQKRHQWHFFFDAEERVMVYCPGPYKSYGGSLPLCGVETDVYKSLPCQFKESGGRVCENLEPHTDEHFYGIHTIAHERGGNGYDCDWIEKILHSQPLTDATEQD